MRGSGVDTAGPMWPPYMAMYAHMYRMYARMYGLSRIHAPFSGTKISTIRKALPKRQALYLIWTSLLALAIFRPYIGAAKGHMWNGPYLGRFILERNQEGLLGSYCILLG